jgi:hypothetical protein
MKGNCVMKKREQIAELRAVVVATLIWFEDGTPTAERSTEENAVIADMRNALRRTGGIGHPALQRDPV